uniref:Uncharacterized protein n=1 Tax=Panagrolaimus davidi TaxID=227884 RepID=A0A914R0I5_9BILA
MSKSQGDLIFDTSLQRTPKRRTSTQMKNSQTNFSNSLQFQNPINISPVTTQHLKFSPSLFNRTSEEESQSNQNQITKWVNENIDFVKVYLKLEDNGIVALQSMLSETEKIQFQNSNNEEKENMLKFRKSETCKFIHSLIQNLIENMEIEAIKLIIFEKKTESEALLITSFIFDGIQNVQNIDDIQIVNLKYFFAF